MMLQTNQKQNLPSSILERRYRFTVQEFELLCENGTLHENQVELLNGSILDTVITNLHHQWTLELHETLLVSLAEKAKISRLLPVSLNKNTRLTPDFVVVALGRYSGQIPSIEDISLVIEIGDTTLETDKSVSLERYAQAGVGEYWVIDAKAEKLEVYREPEGLDYRSKQTFDKGSPAAMLEFPDVPIRWWI
jgi:Uma2 family endonuclease